MVTNKTPPTELSLIFRGDAAVGSDIVVEDSNLRLAGKVFEPPPSIKMLTASNKTSALRRLRMNYAAV